ncbi:TIGR02679 family protein [Micropruina sp.]|uniref:TIGR02679 family protein n=1 Tax=Micropruina sp. TaxID=2737536 RepID=UPI00261EA7A2|nr:TIGR02679 family protein [Micropruina sp.]
MTWSDHLDEVLRAAHARLARDPAARSFQVDLPVAEQREALADLLGTPLRPGTRTRVPLTGPRGLAVAVEQASGLSLIDYLQCRFGPLLDPAVARRQGADQRDELWRWWLGHPLLTARPHLNEWAEQVMRLGARGGPVATRSLLERVLLVLDELPAADELLPVLAGRLLNDTHALDAGRTLTSHILGAVAADLGVDKPNDAAGRRELWRTVGVRDDELSSMVLVAGLRPAGDTTSAQLCRLAAAAGEAASLTLAQVRRQAAPWNAERVYVVENPAILALAVGEFGVRVPPMLCGSGWPSAAVAQLLSRLAAEGATVAYHGDFDGEGVRIANHLISIPGVEPWRMDTDDYLRQVADHGAPVGRVTEASWDAGLAPAMIERGVAVLEETVWPQLRADLERS